MDSNGDTTSGEVCIGKSSAGNRIVNNFWNLCFCLFVMFLYLFGVSRS